MSENKEKFTEEDFWFKFNEAGEFAQILFGQTLATALGDGVMMPEWVFEQQRSNKGTRTSLVIQGPEGEAIELPFGAAMKAMQKWHQDDIAKVHAETRGTYLEELAAMFYSFAQGQAEELDWQDEQKKWEERASALREQEE